MLDRDEDTDARLARLARATELVRPSAGFSARVKGTLARERTADFRPVVVRVGRLVLGIAALVAVGTTALAIAESRAARTSVAVAYGIEEPEW
jgi:hypothetical protein